MALDVRKPKNYRRAWNGGRDLTKRPMTAAEWNEKFPSGTAVIVVKDDGQIWETKTRSEAWELGHGQPVVMLEGKSGGYDLSRVAPR
jgi:hypothetical protein